MAPVGLAEFVQNKAFGPRPDELRWFKPAGRRKDMACRVAMLRMHRDGRIVLPAPPPGAQLRYLVYAGNRLLAALGFGASAWKVSPRDKFRGWSVQEREQNLHRVINNARFLNTALDYIPQPRRAHFKRGGQADCAELA